MNQRNTALCQMHIATLIFGVSGVFGKLITSSAEVIVVGRGFLAFVALSLLLLRWRKKPWVNINAQQIFLSMSIGLLLALHWLTFFLGIKTGGVAVGMLGFAGFPVFVTLIEYIFLKIKPQKIELVLVALVFLGLALVVPSFDASDKGTIGLLWGIVSAVLYAVLTILNRYGIRTIPVSQTCWWQYLVLMLALLPFSLGQLPDVSAKDWLLIAWLGLISTGVAYNLFIKSLLVLKASIASMISSLEPVYAIILAYILFQEIPSVRMLFGGMIIIVAVIFAGQQKG